MLLFQRPRRCEKTNRDLLQEAINLFRPRRAIGRVSNHRHHKPVKSLRQTRVRVIISPKQKTTSRMNSLGGKQIHLQGIRVLPL